MFLLFLEWAQPYMPRIARLALFESTLARASMALTLAFLLNLVLGPWVIRALRRLRAAGQIRKATREGAVDVYESHVHKKDTPIMGGIMIISSVALASLILCDLRDAAVPVTLGVMMGFFALGLTDDLLEIRRKNTGRKGMSAAWKLAGQCALGAILAILVTHLLPTPVYDLGAGTQEGLSTRLTVPFLKHFYPEMGLLYLPFVILVVTASSNAVNLTDGLDGLATGITIISALALAIVVYLVTRVDYALYLYSPFIRDGKELVVILLALAGSCMGFLWYNAHPADVFMGDTGSLAIGGLLGTIAVIVRQELLLIILGGIFVIEAASVIIQVLSYKIRGKRVFLMAPIHHHFEKKGWPEARIITRFWILAALLALFGLSTLKIR